MADNEDKAISWQDELTLDGALAGDPPDNPDDYMHDLGMMGFEPTVPWNLPNVRY
jgi:hypothetical protein